MCNPISLIITEDKAFLPPEKVWNHSHSFIMQTHNIPDGLLGDKYLRLEVTPPDNILRDKETNEKLVIDHTWKVIVDETNIPEWYSDDLANQEDRARESVKKWFDSFPDNLVDGYKEAAGDYAKIITGNGSTLNVGNYSTLNAGNDSTLKSGHDSSLTAGHCSILTAGDWSKLVAGNNSRLTAGNDSVLTAGLCSRLTAGDRSILTAGDRSTLTSGDNSELTAGNYSVFCAGENSSFSSTYCDGKRTRTVTFYVGENGILPNKKYKIKNGKIMIMKQKNNKKRKSLKKI